MTTLSQEDQKIADELEQYITGSAEKRTMNGLDLFEDIEEKDQDIFSNVTGGSLIYTTSMNMSISDSNDIRRVIADMIK